MSISSRLMGDRIAAVYQAHLPRYSRGRLLDLGCGRVPLYGLYRHAVDDVICADWPQSVHGAQFLDVYCDLSKPLPFATASFDVVVLSDVLEHIPSPEALLLEIARLLRPAGVVVLNVPFLYWIHEAPHDYYRYTEFALSRFIKQAGLDTVRLEAIGGLPEVLSDLLAKCFIRLPLVGAAVASALQAMIGFLIYRGIIHREANYTSYFPLGYFVVAIKR